MRESLPKEGDLLNPVLRLFGRGDARTILEAKLSRKRIDVVFAPQSEGQWTAVELKVKNWRRALWQAAVNTQLADFSYVALWHTTVPTAMGSRSLFRSYGVGIISVSPSEASIVLEAERTKSKTRAQQQALLLESVGAMGEKDGDLDALSLLPA